MVFEKICFVLKGFPLRMIRNLQPQDQIPTIIGNALFELYAPESYSKILRGEIEKDYLKAK